MLVAGFGYHNYQGHPYRETRWIEPKPSKIADIGTQWRELMLLVGFTTENQWFVVRTSP